MERARIFVFSSVEVSVSKRPCVSTRIIAVEVWQRKTSDQKAMPVVCRLEPPRHENPVRGAVDEPSHCDGD